VVFARLVEEQVLCTTFFQRAQDIGEAKGSRTACERRVPGAGNERGLAPAGRLVDLSREL
jgi:hypothetical protein